MNPHGKKKSKKGQDLRSLRSSRYPGQNDTPDDWDGEITMVVRPSPSQPDRTTEGTPAPAGNLESVNEERTLTRMPRAAMPRG